MLRGLGWSTGSAVDAEFEETRGRNVSGRIEQVRLGRRKKLGGAVNSWSPKPWVVSAQPPGWLRERATNEAWPGGSITDWRHRLRALDIEKVHAIYTDGQLSAIGLDGHFHEIDKEHPAPVDLALRECIARVVHDQKRTPD